MLRSDSIFGKREPQVQTPVPVSNAATSNATTSPVQPAASGSASTQSNSFSSYSKAPANGAAPEAATGAAEGGSKLIVGPNIKLKGVEITDCDTLVVEGMVEATIRSRVIQIAENGSYKGAAEIEVAEIRGLFDGDLTVRQKLVIHATGKVTGKIRYGKIVIEEGGQFSGDVQAGFDDNSKVSVLSRATPANALAS